MSNSILSMDNIDAKTSQLKEKFKAYYVSLTDR